MRLLRYSSIPGSTLRKGSPSLCTSLRGSGKRPGLPQLRSTYPVSLPGSPPSSMSEGGERTQQRLSSEPKASYVHIHPSQIYVSLGLPAPNLHPKLQPAFPARNTTVVWFASCLRKTPEQETCISERAQQDRGNALPGEGPQCPPSWDLSRGAHPETAVEAR